VPDVTIEVLRELDEPTYLAIRELLPQLRTQAIESVYEPTHAELAEVVGSPSTHLLLARSGGEVLGILTLVMVRLPSARVAHIEDVVVHERSRGQGVGSLLITEALAMAKDGGATHVDLTSRPRRTAANRLYQSLGFQARDTNVYRFPLTSD
jgi:ribosomal protein S18 acetylase RimI-like enzyme